jgi:hypothetical protein
MTKAMDLNEIMISILKIAPFFQVEYDIMETKRG